MTTPKKDQVEKDAKPNRRGARKSPTGATATTGRKERRLGETERRREWHPPDFVRYPPVGTGDPAPLVGPTINATDITSADIVTGEPPRAPIQLCIDRINVALIGVEGTLDEVGDALQSILAVPPESKEDPKPGYQGTSEMTSRLNGYENRLNLIRVAMEGIRDRIEL